MNLFGVMDISASALLAERQRAEIVASNLANSETSGTANGKVYKRQEIVFGSAQMPFHDVLSSVADRNAEGVQVLAVQNDPAPPPSGVTTRETPMPMRRVMFRFPISAR